jgi:hypothetical protein
LVANRYEFFGNHFRDAKRLDATINVFIKQFIVKVYIGDAYPNASIGNQKLFLESALDGSVSSVGPASMYEE